MARTKGSISPKQYLLQIMRDETADKAERNEAAKLLLPYCHKRLTGGVYDYHIRTKHSEKAAQQAKLIGSSFDPPSANGKHI